MKIVPGDQMMYEVPGTVLTELRELRAEVARLREAATKVADAYTAEADPDIAVVREFIGGCLALHGFREDCPACVAYRKAHAALDRLAARLATAEAERDRLREALRYMADYQMTGSERTLHIDFQGKARAALKDTA